MQKNTFAAIAALVVLLSALAVAIPATDGDADASDDPEVSVTDLLEQTGSAGFVLKLDDEKTLALLVFIASLLSSDSDEEDGTDDDIDASDYLLNTESPTLAGLLTYMEAGDWTEASFDSTVAARISSEKADDGHTYALTTSGSFAYSISMTPEGADEGCILALEGTASYSASAKAAADSDLVFGTFAASADVSATAAGTINFEETEDGYVKTDAQTIDLVDSGRIDASATIDGLTVADIEALADGSVDTLEKNVAVVLRASDSLGNIAGYELRGTVDLASGYGEDEQYVGDDAGDGEEETSLTDVIASLIAAVFGEDSTFYYDFGALTYNTDAEATVTEAVGETPSRDAASVVSIDGDYSLAYWKETADTVVHMEYDGASDAPSEILGYPAEAVDSDDDPGTGYSTDVKAAIQVEKNPDGTASGINLLMIADDDLPIQSGTVTVSYRYIGTQVTPFGEATVILSGTADIYYQGTGRAYAIVPLDLSGEEQYADIVGASAVFSDGTEEYPASMVAFVFSS